MKKAFLVKASVMTRIEIDNMSDDEIYNTTLEKAKNNLLNNLSNDYMDCIDSVEEDYECPYVPNEEELKEKKQYEEYRSKFFKVNGMEIVSRVLYETLPASMYAMEFTDEQMQDLAENIFNEMICYDFEIKDIERFFKDSANMAFDNVDLFDDINTAYW